MIEKLKSFNLSQKAALVEGLVMVEVATIKGKDFDMNKLFFVGFL